MMLIYWQKDTFCMEEGRSFLVASKDAGLEVNDSKNTYMRFCQNSLGQSHNITIADWKCGRVQIFGTDFNK